MKLARILVGLGLVFALSQSASAASIIFDIHLFGSTGEPGGNAAGVGEVTAVDLGSGRYGVTSGTLVLVTSSGADTYTLHPVSNYDSGTSWGGWEFNDVLYYPAMSTGDFFDVYGLAFAGDPTTAWTSLNLYSVDGFDYLGTYSSGSTGWPYDDYYLSNLTVTPRSEPVPEPATLTLVGVGLAGLVRRAVRRRR
jgi:hypothetical protein